jgi:hypothetical protein
MKLSSLLFVTLVLALLLTGCSSFGGKWRAAREEPVPTNDISGPWEGRWISDKNGHNGRLRALLTPIGEDSYEAFFHATFWKLFSSSYVVPIQFKRDGHSYVFSGEANLGKLAGGHYSYSGTATATHYQSGYKSKYDHGRFEMSRPARKTQAANDLYP